MVEITLTQYYTRLAENRFREQKMFENDRKEIENEAVTPIRRRNQNPRGELIDIFSILKVKSTSTYPRRIDFKVSKWICLSKPMKSRRTFHVKFLCRIYG